MARRNAYGLAKGYRDLALLLEEPADSEDVVDHAAPGGFPPTIHFLSQQLQEGSGTRDWENTCIVDMRPFHSSLLRDLETSNFIRERNDFMSYDATEEMVEILQPDVLVKFQTATASVRHDFARCMSSSIRTSGRLSLYKLRTGKQVIVVDSFHPMYALKYANAPEVAQLRQAMIKFNILQAVNLLAGRVIVRNGENKLRDADWGASHNPPRLLPSGRLDPQLDDIVKGIFLADNATPEMKELWNGISKEQKRKLG